MGPKHLGTIRILWDVLSRKRKKQFGLLFVCMLFGGLAEAISLGLVVPFLGAMAAPEKILTWLKQPGAFSLMDSLAGSIHISANSLLCVLAIGFAASALLVAGIRLQLLATGSRLANHVGTDLSLQVYRRTLYQPYQVHLCRNSSTIISSLTTKITQVSLIFSHVLTILTSATVIFFISMTLFLISPGAVLASAAIMGLFYGIMAAINNRKLSQNSRLIATEQNQIVKSLQESLGGIRDILLDGLQEAYCEIYRRAEVVFRSANANVAILGQSPRFIMEAGAMLLFSALALGLAQRAEGMVAALPTLGVLALGFQRILPALQQSYVAWTAIVAYQTPAHEVVELLKQPLPESSRHPAPPALRFEKEICFEEVRFRYAVDSPWVLDGVSFVLAKGRHIGFVGRTGAGKSTCLDLLMGLLEPSAGRILIDGRLLDKGAVPSWQRNVAHVPQTIFLSDCSLAENIAFGTPSGKIDMARVREVAQQAQIADFIESKPEKYGTFVGERGIRLSGGQRQRIGIARALYKQAKVLILDEATSALDGETEDAILESLYRLSPDLTILMIAHRLTSLKNCTQVISLKDGKTEVILPKTLTEPQAV